MRAIDGSVDINQLINLPESIARWVDNASSVESCHKLLKNFGIVDVSDLGQFEATDDKYNEVVNGIISTMVKPPIGKRNGIGRSRVHTSVRRSFLNYGVLGSEADDVNRGLVVPNYPIDESENFYADFAVKNGRFLITETIDYRITNPNPDKFKETGLKAIKLDQAKRNLGNDTECFVLYAASKEKTKGLTPYFNSLSDYASQILNIESDAEKSFYFDRVLKIAGDQVQVN